MKFCQYCGQQMEDGAVVCSACGKAIADTSQPAQPQMSANSGGGQVADARSGGFAFLCFLFPVLGLILFLVWRDQYPLKAKSCGKGALIGLITGVAIGIIGIIIVLSTGAAFINEFVSYSLPIMFL